MKLYSEKIRMFVLIPTLMFDFAHTDISIVWLIWNIGIMKKENFQENVTNE